MLALWTERAHLFCSVSAAFSQLLVKERIEEVELGMLVAIATWIAVVILYDLGIVVHDSIIDKLSWLQCTQIISRDLNTANLPILGVGVFLPLHGTAAGLAVSVVAQARANRVQCNQSGHVWALGPNTCTKHVKPAGCGTRRHPHTQTEKLQS
jgi:hypothetical protein